MRILDESLLRFTLEREITVVMERRINRLNGYVFGR